MLPALTGYSIFGSVGGNLTPDQFVFEGNTYRVLILFHASEGLWLAMSRDLPVDLTLRVGDATYHASESKIPAVNTGTRGFWWPEAQPDWLGDAPVGVSLTLHPEIPLGDRPKAPVAGYFTGIPTDHDGAEDISFRVYFSEGVATTADALRDHVLAVSSGAVSRVDAVDSEGRIWAITVTPGAWAPITIRIAANRNCDRPEAICTSDGRRLFNTMELVVPTKPNHPPTGAPTISGEIEVGNTLTVDTSGISDADGITAGTFTYQWISVGTVRNRDIPGATGPTYTPVPADARKAIKVKVSFTDGAGKTESLTSTARTERPRTLTAANSGGAVVLTWELPARWSLANSYYILRSSPELGETVPLVRLRHLPAGQTTYTDTDVEPDVLYVYRVSGINSFGEPLDASEPVEIRTPQPDPASNSPATGTPTINGEPNVGEVLTAGTSGIADADGLHDVTFTYQWLADDAAIAGATHSSYTTTAADENKTLKVRVAFTDDQGNDETLLSAPTAAISAATTELTAEFRGIPPSHDGQNPFTVELRFSEEFEVLYADLRDHSFTATAGTVTKARRLDPPHNIRWEITIQPDSDADVTVLLPATQNCDDQGALCTPDTRMLATDITVTITGLPANSPATGTPTINGEPNVGEMLTVGTSGIADADGLHDVTFTYQWLADDAAIAGATHSSYTTTAADENKTLKVRVAFTDEQGNDETLLSAPTAAISAATTELTAEFRGIPPSHDGQNPFTVELRFSEEFEVLYADLRDHSFTATAGTVTKARRLDRPHNIRWEITIQPDSDADVTVLLPATQNCDDQGALCTPDTRMLATDITVTITGLPANSPATGTPTINGEPNVGEMLTVGTSGIADADGLHDVTFTYQWLADDAAIAGATHSSYTTTAADENKTLKVRVAFTDEQGNDETLLSAPTAAISVMMAITEIHS